jgi:hypothetical protein
MLSGKPGVSLGSGCLLAVLAGCAAGVQTSPPRSSGDVLIGTDLSQYRTVYEAVEALRGSWFSGHAVMACRCDPVVYVNGSRVRGLDVLRQTAPTAGVVVKHLSAREAAARFGGGHEGGAILIEAVRLL